MTEEQKLIICDLAAQAGKSIHDLLQILVDKNLLELDENTGDMFATSTAYLVGLFDSTGVKTKLQVLSENEDHRIGVAYYDGKPIQLVYVKATDQILYDADSIARHLGYKNAHEMFSQDQVLDIFNASKAATGEWPIKELPIGLDVYSIANNKNESGSH